MGIIQALKQDGENLRVSNGTRWLIWNIYDNYAEWVVYERKYGAHKTKEVYRGIDEGLAVDALLNKNEQV